MEGLCRCRECFRGMFKNWPGFIALVIIGFVSGTALRDSYCVLLWGKAIVPSWSIPFVPPRFYAIRRTSSFHSPNNRSGIKVEFYYIPPVEFSFSRWKERVVVVFFYPFIYLFFSLYSLSSFLRFIITKFVDFSLIDTRYFLTQLYSRRSVLDFCFERNLFPTKI